MGHSIIRQLNVRADEPTTIFGSSDSPRRRTSLTKPEQVDECSPKDRVHPEARTDDFDMLRISGDNIRLEFLVGATRGISCPADVGGRMVPSSRTLRTSSTSRS